MEAIDLNVLFVEIQLKILLMSNVMMGLRLQETVVHPHVNLKQMLFAMGDLLNVLFVETVLLHHLKHVMTEILLQMMAAHLHAQFKLVGIVPVVLLFVHFVETGHLN